ncbi:hypothetical protein IMCC3088_2396 [Aequoribacter fuscus]|jgi:uncharacterized protein (DUF58 family)|uniref:DUF58 domain-containing protein n=1 Tax=Aequoribacter fuscus TaxID=2518989 RepID=F3L415_9GAMM|nr:DUF58 domain-containing protein [Aequoribacter fuscus]EGG28936.1 hypothetical protein IMCC3088_2396 [Aequoribacter fuscus]QHJ88342.1 DUF58 domain-containing protein [Aequoribacter fuscus]
MKWFKGINQEADSEQDDRVAVSLARLRALEFTARGFSFLPRQPVNSILSGRHGSRLRGRGLNFEELRHYRPGDDIRTMDWKVTNRTGKPHVRVYTEEKERQIFLFVDQRVSMYFGSEHAMKSAVAAEIAALAAWRVLGSGDRVGALIFDDQNSYYFKPQRSRETVFNILKRLEKTNAALSSGCQANAEQFNEAFDVLLRYVKHDALVIYIGDGFGWNEQSDEKLKRLSIKNDVIAIKVFDRAEQELPNLQELVVSDGEMQIIVSGTHQQLQSRFEDSYLNHVKHMSDALERFGLPLIEINTVDDPLRQLLIALGSKIGAKI